MRKPRSVFITGIAGTLGRAFVELLHTECRVAGVDHNEHAVAQLRADYPDIAASVGDFGYADTEGYDLLIHLAAMKHIDLCETNATSCVLTNVVKTLYLFQTAKSTHTDILFMSTDKAVEPSSIYGYSKAIAEGMVRELGGAFARSGNIVASNGSVFGIWERAIERGEPLKITHPDMRRFFITPQHLAERIWRQYLSGVREIIPAMDKDAKLTTLAAELLERHGKSIESYPIEYIGLRPGEKLREKLTWETQG